jgi:dephospho-CoA kinase
MSIKIGITGGIGSGKTFICKIIEHLGYPVFYSDDVARSITETDDSVIDSIKKYFGEKIYFGRKLNRKLLASIVFNDKSKLEMLNSIIHPAVASYFEEWCKLNSHHKLVFKEAAILFESGAYKKLDKNILVTAPLGIRIKRVMERDGVGEQAVKERVKNQMPEDEKIKHADFVIINDSEHLVVPQVVKIIESVLK